MIIVIVSLVVLNIVFLSAAVYYRQMLSHLKSRTNSVELEEFLMDLLSGGGLIHVKRIASSDVILRARR
jgi:hypothetical protein